jgi:glucose/arabinose dehydrogenase
MPESCCGHRTKPITFDEEGHLYSQVGSPSNACQKEADKPDSPGMQPCTLLDEHGGVFRFSASARNQVHARDGVRYSRGHRNVIALEWNAEAHALYGLMHGRDGEVTGAWETFADDFERVRAASGAVARPSGLGIGPDGSLYIVDDTGGRIWKVTYRAGRPR